MLKFKDNKCEIEGSGEDLLMEYAKLTNALKFAIMKAEDDHDSKEFAEFLLFTAFKGGLDAPDPKKKKDEGEKELLKFLDDLIESVKKGD